MTASRTDQNAARRRSGNTVRAHLAATLVEIAGWVFAAIGVLAGIAVYNIEILPGVVGLGVIAISVLVGAVVVMIAAYVQSQTE